MKIKIVILLLVICSINILAQKQEDANLIQLDSTWGKEIFPFPIRFAKNINYTGIADVRFPPKGWRDVNHQNFWSYTYAWRINLNREITVKELAANLEKYFDGLNSVDLNDKADKRKASAIITKTKRKGTTTFFKGAVKTYDHFATNERIILNTLIESHYCNLEKRTVILFKFSPKEFNHKTWKMLEKVKLHTPLCN